jgi:hypothetical protein
MKINPNVFIIGGTSLLVAVTAYAAVNHVQNSAEIDNITGIINNAGNVGANGQTLVQTDISTLDPGSFPINYGDTNQQMYAVQQQLNRIYNANLPLTGQYDAASADVLCQWWDTCFSWYPESTKQGYTILQTDYEGMVNHKSYGA